MKLVAAASGAAASVSCAANRDEQRDSDWSFRTPAISAGWLRFALLDQMGIPHKNRPKHD
ncbi:hypothetical protein [Paraglaciecola arctica]|uniref:hypothetical protein n=1 Tax=Paraglaciecola arctica TaxID=1128911 RepID=UPI001C07396D|nr:hypothetical protein [Paraglaciecola arctica]MBU3005275.1 hypothetical protein [Paraglaciecola arctica]